MNAIVARRESSGPVGERRLAEVLSSRLPESGNADRESVLADLMQASKSEQSKLVDLATEAGRVARQ
jgi:hypothetical protein